MNFDLVLEQLLEGFDRLNIRYAVIGGFAVASLGYQRATDDLDFLVHREDLEKVHLLMTGLKYSRIHGDENFTQYQGEVNIWGFVDFQHAFRPLGLKMLTEAVEQSAPMRKPRNIKVVRAEDIIGLKVQALVNNPDRKSQDTADIEGLLRAAGRAVDWKRVEEYYNLFNLAEEFKALRKRINHA